MKCKWEILVKALPVILLFAFIIDSAESSDSNNVAARQDRTELKVTVDPQAERSANYHINRGFHWTKELSELLGQYEKQRDKYQTLDAFMPEIVKLFGNYEGPPKK